MDPHPPEFPLSSLDTAPPSSEIRIDREGRWYHRGAEMVRREFVRAFYRQLLLSSDGSYSLSWNGGAFSVDVEDTAYVVWRVEEKGEPSAAPDGYLLFLSDDTTEPLDPGTLFQGEDHVLYCRVKGGGFPARFSRPAYYQLSAHVLEDRGTFLLPIGSRRYPIPGA